MSGRSDADAALRRLLDEEATAQAARARERSRWLRQQASEETTLVDVLVACLEAGEHVQIRTVTGARHEGVLEGVGPDWCRLAGSWHTYVSVQGITHVQAALRVAGSDRSPSHSARLIEVLTELAPERPQVRVEVASETIAGTLVAGGADLLSVELPGTGSTAHIPCGSIAAVSVRPS